MTRNQHKNINVYNTMANNNSDFTEVPGMEMTTDSSISSQGPPEASVVPVAAIAGGVVGGLAAAFLLIIIALLLLFIIKSRTEVHNIGIAIYAQSP